MHVVAAPFMDQLDEFIHHPETITRGVYKKAFLKISQYSLENTCVGVSF